MTYQERRAEECRKLFEGFAPDLEGCRRPEFVLKVLELARSGLFSHEIAARTGATPKAVQKTFRRYKFPVLYNFVPPLREERPGWKGGVKVVGDHAYQRCPGHPHASKWGNYVPVGRLVLEEHLGRFLTQTEVVHHLDGNPLNNNITNLKLFENNGEHLRETLTGRPHAITPEGKKRIREAVILSNQRRGRKVDATLAASETDGP